MSTRRITLTVDVEITDMTRAREVAMRGILGGRRAEGASNEEVMEEATKLSAFYEANPSHPYEPTLAAVFLQLGADNLGMARVRHFKVGLAETDGST